MQKNFESAVIIGGGTMGSGIAQIFLEAGKVLFEEVDGPCSDI